MSNRSLRKVHMLAGPTATGKTDLAHRLARKHEWAVLSADSMLVYRGMDIGTAKPLPADRAGLRYGGIDLATPDQSFDVGAWLAHARDFLQELPAEQEILVVGGTGLYFKALLYGLDPMPSVDPAVREWAERIYEDRGLDGLRRTCQELASERYAALKDKDNPRRLMRALELERMGAPHARVWEQREVEAVPVVLHMPRGRLDERIEARVERMFRDGLLDEVRRLQTQYPVWSDTASGAIGYREACAVLNGEMDEAEARASIARRTRQLARRQLTWFRHQLACEWVDINPGTSEEELAENVYAVWRRYGPCSITG